MLLHYTSTVELICKIRFCIQIFSSRKKKRSKNTPVLCILISIATSQLLNWELNQSPSDVNSGCSKLSCLSSAHIDSWVSWDGGMCCWPWVEMQQLSALSRTRTGGILGLAGLLPSHHIMGCMTNILIIILLFKGNKDAKPNPRKQGVVHPEAAILFIEKNAVLKILMFLWDASRTTEFFPELFRLWILNMLQVWK